MPIASGLGFVEREHPPNVIRTVNTITLEPETQRGVTPPSNRERLLCCILITSVVTGSLATLAWFVATFEST